MAVDISIERISPKVAKDWLESSNPDNRPIRKGVVDRYARDIKAKKWNMTGDAIRFNGNGMLIDGQHRLAAIVKAGKGIKTIVIRGLDQRAKMLIDTGAKRGFADVLHYMGYKDRNQLAALVRWCWMYENGHLMTRTVPTTAELIEWLDNNPDVVHSNAFVCRHIPYFGLKTILASIHYYTRTSLPGEAEAFLTTIKEGQDISSGHPVFTLRRWLMWAMSSSKRPLPIVTQGIVIKSWNAFIEGRKIDNLRFIPGGSRPEKFPTIVTQYPGTMK